MSLWEVRVTKTAESDLADAALYIRDALCNLQAALRLLDEFERCVDDLSKHPVFRPLVHDDRLARMGYRWIPVGGYMAFHTLDEDECAVSVERVLYARSDWRAVL